MAPQAPSSRRWFTTFGVIFVLLGSAGGYIAWRAKHIDEQIRKRVARGLSDRFDSRVELGAVQVRVFPRPSVTGENLSIYFHARTDVPPLIHIDKLSFYIGWFGILRLPHRVDGATLENMTITIPPRGEKKLPRTDSGKPKEQSLPVIVDTVICKNTILITLPRKPEPGKPEKEPLEWDIHDLVLHSASADKPFSFHGTLTNAKPKGEIDTSGEFGPWSLGEPGLTPVSGTYKFTDADLGPLPGIAGILSSTGKYSGQLSELQVEGETDTPDFSLDKVGKPVPLHTEYSATVDGTDDDTLLHPVRATLVRSVIIAEGSVINVKGKGHNIALAISAPNARIQDILSLALNSDKPVLSGPAKIKVRLLLPPGKEKALEKMILDGEVGIEDALWASPEIRQKLEGLSRRAEGKPGDDDAGSAVSDLKGKFHVEKGLVTFSSLTFGVPGAAIDLAGTYDIRGGQLDFNGHLRMQAKLSQTVTGTKSFFLKALDPFFEKNGAGTEVPLSISGTRDNPNIGVTVFHKTIRKDLKNNNPGNGKTPQK
jgi:AsmA-like C-terminal region